MGEGRKKTGDYFLRFTIRGLSLILLLIVLYHLVILHRCFNFISHFTTRLLFAMVVKNYVYMNLKEIQHHMLLDDYFSTVCTDRV